MLNADLARLHVQTQASLFLPPSPRRWHRRPRPASYPVGRLKNSHFLLSLAASPPLGRTSGAPPPPGSAYFKPFVHCRPGRGRPRGQDVSPDLFLSFLDVLGIIRGSGGGSGLTGSTSSCCCRGLPDHPPRLAGCHSLRGRRAPAAAVILVTCFCRRGPSRWSHDHPPLIRWIRPNTAPVVGGR